MAGKREFRIETPRNTTVQMAFSGGQMDAKLEWGTGFASRKRRQFSEAQMYVDSECLRLMNPLTPMRTGAMIKSATNGTVIGSGEIRYLSPYARRQYYENKGGSPKHPQGGKLWFLRMKAQHRDAILKGAARYLNNG